MNPADAYAIGFGLLAAWGVLSSRKSFKAGGRWSRLRWQILLADLFFTAGCALCAAALALGWFRPWMVLPLGAILLGMVPLPCYFDWVNHIGSVRAARDVLFVVVAAVCFAVGFKLVPLAFFGF